MSGELRKTESKVIGGITFEVTQLGALKASKVFFRLLKVLGPAFASKDIGKLFSLVTEDDLDYFINAFSETTFVKGAPQASMKNGPLNQTFDFVFVGAMKDMMEWLLFCIQLNFSDFLKGGAATSTAAGIGQVLDQLSGSTSPTSATGSSGAS